MSDTGKDKTEKTENQDKSVGDYRSFLILKTEKLTSAAYMLTDFLVNDEPLKWKIRENTLLLLTLIRKLQCGSAHLIIESMRSAIDSIGQVLSFMQIAKNAGYISQMNYSLMEREFKSLISFLQKRLEMDESTSVSGLELGPSLETIAIGAPNAPGESHIPYSGTSNLRPGESVPNAALTRGTSSGKVIQVVTVDGREDRAINSKGHNVYGINTHNEDGGQIGRKENILSIIQGKNEYTIKDIASHIPEVSEKTIQRDLQVLVQAGVLHRRGERRWSRYYRA